MPRCFVPNMWATIPLVAGTVDNQRNPKLAPNIKALMLLAGRKINKQIEIPLKDCTQNQKVLILMESYLLFQRTRLKKEFTTNG